jgi:hypothetical protein
MANDDKRLAEDKKKLAADRDAREKAREEREKSRGRPTPTQEEIDLIKLGHHVELSPDGSPPDPNVGFGTRQVEAQPASGGYHTRQSTPASRHTEPKHAS